MQRKIFAFALGFGLLALSGFAELRPAQAQEQYIGEVRLFGMTWCPRSFVPANGQLLAISQHTALFSLYGTIYGGDGRTTFGLPDLRGRAPISYGQGPGLNNHPIGVKGGAESFTLNVNNMPSHTHSATTTATLHASSGSGSSPEPSDNVLADDGNDNIYSNVQPDVTMSNQAITATTSVNNSGQGQSVTHRGPYQAMNWCVALEGIYPSRS